MSELIKKPYEISLWNDEVVYIVTEGAENERYETTTLQEGKNYTVLNQYVKENCLAVIGSHTLNTPIRAFEPKLTQQVTGTNTLTFQIYSKYYDEDEEEFKANPFISLLVNEQKVKLHYNDEWFEFIIKEIQEKSEGNIFSYTCKDLYINELAKSGYNLEFNVELENNQGTIVELGEKILEESDWEIDKENSEIIQQKNKEALFTCELAQEIKATCMNDFTYGKISYRRGETITIPKGQVIYVFYSSYTNKENPVQFLYHNITSLEDNYITDEDGVILNSPNWQFDPTEYPDFFESKLKITTSYFGEKLVSKHLSKYLGEIDKYCSIYSKDGINYYSYSETEYASVTEVQNLLTNANNFISTNGWVGINGSEVNISNVGAEPSLQLKFSASGTVINTGLYENRAITKGFTKGEKYIFAVKYSGGEITNAEISGSRAGVDGKQVFFTFNKISNGIAPSTLDGYHIFEGICKTSVSYDNLLKYDLNFYVNGKSTVELLDARLFKEIIGDNGKLIVPDLEETINSIARTKCYFFPCSLIDGVSPQKVFSTNDIAFSTVCYEDEIAANGYAPVSSQNYEKIRSITGSKSNRFNLIQELCEAFECWAKFVIEHDDKGRVLYDYEALENEDFVEGKTYYKKCGSTKAGKVDINYRLVPESEIFNYQKVAAGATLNPLVTYYNKNHEELLYNEGNFKNTQTNLLLEPKWDFKDGVEYYTRSIISGLYQKKYSKNVVFKKFIGQDNPVGFRYGINLKSIQRTINSDQVVSKLIVEPNVNEYAEGGSCTIQTSVLNPTGENTLYNFDYYIRHKLLDREALYNDLYGTNGGLGLYIKMREWNDQVTPLINESVPISSTLNSLTSRRLTYSVMVTENEKLYEEAVNEIVASTHHSYDRAKTLTVEEKDAAGNNLSDYAKDYIRRRDRAKTTIDNYNEMLSNTETLIEGYNHSLSAITHKLNQITKKKKALNADFYKKYSRFIQEGSWTSSDHIDPEDYYLDSQMVLYTSAFPKVTYTINVIEISQIEGFEPYFFKVGDKTYMEDTEFFGWNMKGRPYQEEIVVSEVTYGLDDPAKNTIKVQNYKNQFEDLFQRITAVTQSLQYHEGEYKRAANVINPDGSIRSSLLQDSMNNNNLIIKNAKDESVVWDETGITITNFLNPSNIVRLVSGGIVLSSDGGRTWTTGITGEGINASVVTTGRLDTNRIRIFNSNHQTFEWNSDGISAFMIGDGTGIPNYSKFVRFNQYGLFGYVGDTNEKFESITEVLDKANFSLTWKGLKINLPSGQEEEVLNINNNFMIDGAGNVTIRGGVITWKTTEEEGINPPNISDIPGFNTYIDKIDDAASLADNAKKIGDALVKGLGFQETEITGSYVISPVIAGGTLLIGDPKKVHAQITSAGKLICSGAEISGTLTASTIEAATITGTLDSNGGIIIGPALSIGGGATKDNPSLGKFYVDSAGNVTMSGNITLSGTISWDSKTNPTKVLYRAKVYDEEDPTKEVIPSIPSKNYTDYKDSNSSDWHKNLSSSDYYASYSYNNGAAGSWTPVIKIRGEDGAPGAPGKDAVLPNWIENTKITDNYIETPLLDANLIRARGCFQIMDPTTLTETVRGCIGYATGNDGDSETRGVAITAGINNTNLNNSTAPYLIITETGARMTYNDAHIYVSKADNEGANYVVRMENTNTSIHLGPTSISINGAVLINGKDPNVAYFA